MDNKRDAVEILNGFIADICVAVEVLKDYESGIYPNRDSLFRQGIYRLCLQSIILNCAKYTEFCREYGFVLKECCPDLQGLSNQVKSELERRDVNSVRSKYIAHNRCDKTKKPLTVAEIDALIIKVMGNSSALPFINFLMPDNFKEIPREDYFVGFLETMRDRILEKL